MTRPGEYLYLRGGAGQGSREYLLGEREGTRRGIRGGEECSWRKRGSCGVLRWVGKVKGWVEGLKGKGAWRELGQE